MHDWSSFSIFFGSVLLVAALASALRAGLIHSGKRHGMPLLTSQTENLAPAEVAYLLRDGDMSHTMIVLVVDLIHRAVKSKTDAQPLNLRPYERQVWSNVTDFVKRWAKHKASDVITLSPPTNPLQWYLRARALKTFVGETLRTFVKEVVKDPRHLKRYFSMTGIARLAIELYTSAARQGVESELHGQLLRSGMLVPESQRKAIAAKVAGLIPVAVASIIIINYSFFAHLSWPVVIAFALMGLVNGLILQLLISIPGFIPSYDEFAKVAAELAREGFRLRLVRTMLRLSKIAVLVVAVILSAILLIVEIGINTLFIHLSVGHMLALVVPWTITWLLICRLLLDVHQLTFTQLPTVKAEQALHDTQQRLSTISPLSSFSKVLSDPQYDPTFSELVAVYGIETLWLLS